MDNRDWLAEVQQQLAHTSALSEAHRGAYTINPPDVHVLFGNGGDDEVLLLRSLLPDVGATILAYGEAAERPCWAMIVRCGLKTPLLSEIVSTAWEATHAGAQAPVRPWRRRDPVLRFHGAVRASLN